jgi:hypothetical protein
MHSESESHLVDCCKDTEYSAVANYSCISLYVHYESLIIMEFETDTSEKETSF